jgi:signal transduction histidine kinase
LAALAQVVVSGGGIEPALEAILQTVVRISAGDSGSLYLHDAEIDRLRLAVSLSDGETLVRRDAFAAVFARAKVAETAGNAEPVDRNALRPNRLLIYGAADFERNPFFAGCRDFLSSRGIASLLCAPLFVEERLLGMVAVRSSRPNAFGAQLQRIVQPVIASGAWLIQGEHWRRAAGEPWELRERELTLAQKRRELETLTRALETDVAREHRNQVLADAYAYTLSRSLNLLAADPDVDKFLGHTLKAITEGLGAIGATIWFPTEDRKELHLHLECVDGVVYQAGESPNPAARTPLTVQSSTLIADIEAWRVSRVLSIDDINLSPPYRAYLDALGIRNLLTIPLRHADRVFGWIVIRQGEAPVAELERGKDFAEALAAQATLALHLSRIAEQARGAAALDERNRLAREIHDTLAQSLTAVIVQLEAAERAQHSADAARRESHLASALAMARQCLIDARRSAHALRPPSTQQGRDLERSIRQYLQSTTAGLGLRARLAVQGHTDGLPLEIEHEIHRTIREALTNTLRHAHANQFVVELHLRPRSVQLSISDDGIGFEPSQATEGMGLALVRERIEQLGGIVSIWSRPAEGTLIEATLGHLP